MKRELVEMPQNIEAWTAITMDCDCEEPYMELCENKGDREIFVAVPAIIADYLRTTHGGSMIMRNMVMEQGRNEVRREMRKAMGLS